MDKLIEGVELTPLKIISNESGSVRHGLKCSESQFHQFGEAYFSTVNEGIIKGWKKHTQMISNLIVISGKIKFVIFDDREDSQTKGMFNEIILSESNYNRLTIHPRLWMAFQGLSDEPNMLLNIASIEHNPAECINEPIHSELIDYRF
ncbi:MAG: WxcM-like domain-containing protein [Bacteroidia bacterium]